MSAHVLLTNSYGDQMSGYRLHVRSDMPATIQVNGTKLYEEVWVERGWTVTDDERF